MDLSSRKDIELLIGSFYDKVTKDELIGFIFNDVMKVNWEEHLPVMYDFWETMLFNTAKYSKNAMGVHFKVNQKVKLEEKHFERWLKLFTSTVDELFIGENADLAKKSAKSIAAIMLIKMNQANEAS